MLATNGKNSERPQGVKTAEQPSPGRVRLTLQPNADADEAINEVVKTIVRLGIRVQGVSLLSPSLDEIYFNYVQEAVNQ